MEVRHCRAQHEVLVSFIRYHLQNWGPRNQLPLSYWSDPTSILAYPRELPLTPALKVVLTRARVLSEECCRPSPPLEAALRHAGRSQAFTDIVKEIQWCLSVVSHGRKCKNVVDKSSPELKEFPWEAKTGHYEQELLMIAEQQDWHNVLEKLMKWVTMHEHDQDCTSAQECGNKRCPDRRFCLGAQIMEKWSKQNISSNYLRLPMLFSFDEEVLMHGRPLGSGAFGAVSKATWLGIEFAEKIFSSGGSSLLRAEAEALGQLNHPHIVKVHACSENSLLLDLMSTDLYKFIKARMQGGARDEPFSLPAAMDLMLQIAEAVSYLHTQGMAHRDLKSTNILVDPVFRSGVDMDGHAHAKVADFGLAKVKHEITNYSHLTHNIGTRTYMAPEIFGANEDDEHLEHAYPMKADVYSFGVICSEILTGEEPYSGVARSLLYAKLTGPIPLRPRLPKSCPTALASLICSCWDADPRERPTFADVCQVLRYLKGIQILDGAKDSCWNPIDGRWPFGRLPPLMEVHGPLATNLLPQPLDIRGVKVTFDNSRMKNLLGFTMTCFSEGQLVQYYVGLEHGIGYFSTEWIMFDYPSEYLVQVETSSGLGKDHDVCVTSITFITTKQKYGPYGKVYPTTTLYPSSPMRIVGFNTFPFCAYVIKDVVRCLRHFLLKKDSST